jgi:hypothetical protein
MIREPAKPIAQLIGVLAVVAFFLVAWFFDLQVRDWPGWVLLTLIVGGAALVTYIAINVTKRFL